MRQWILASRLQSAVLLSTHHVDDISIVSDRVWYLNNRFLRYDGPLSSLQDIQHSAGGSGTVNNSGTSSPAVTKLGTRRKAGFLKTVRFLDFEISWGPKALEFTMGSDHVLRLLKIAIKEDSRAALFWGEDASRLVVHGNENQRGGKSGCISISVPGNLNSFLFGFVQKLEKTGCMSWSVVSPNIFKTVTAAANDFVPNISTPQAANLKRECEVLRAEKAASAAAASTLPPADPESSLFCWVGAHGSHIWSIMRLRWKEIKTFFAFFSLFHTWVPLLIVWVIVASCSSDYYPKLQLASEYPSLPSMGEVRMGGLLLIVDSSL